MVVISEQFFAYIIQVNSRRSRGLTCHNHYHPSTLVCKKTTYTHGELLPGILEFADTPFRETRNYRYNCHQIRGVPFVCMSVFVVLCSLFR